MKATKSKIKKKHKKFESHSMENSLKINNIFFSTECEL